MQVETRHRFILISVLCGLGFGWMAWLVSYEKVGRFDRSIIDVVQGWEADWLTAVMKFFAFIGDRYQVVALSVLAIVILFFVFRQRKQLILFIWASLGSVALNETLKVMFARERPEIYRLAEQSGYSFPSGHAMAALTLYFVLTYLLWQHVKTRRGRVIMLVVAISVVSIIGLSRIYLGVHYPSDVIAGYCMSGCWLALSIWLYRMVFGKVIEE